MPFQLFSDVRFDILEEYQKVPLKENIKFLTVLYRDFFRNQASVFTAL